MNLNSRFKSLGTDEIGQLSFRMIRTNGDWVCGGETGRGYRPVDRGVGAVDLLDNSRLHPTPLCLMVDPLLNPNAVPPDRKEYLVFTKLIEEQIMEELPNFRHDLGMGGIGNRGCGSEILGRRKQSGELVHFDKDQKNEKTEELPFYNMCKQRFTRDDADRKAVELFSKWQDEVCSPSCIYFYSMMLMKSLRACTTKQATKL